MKQISGPKKRWMSGGGGNKSGEDGGEERKKTEGNERLIRKFSGTLTSLYFEHCCIYCQHSNQTKQLSVNELTPSAEALL